MTEEKQSSVCIFADILAMPWETMLLTLQVMCFGESLFLQVPSLASFYPAFHFLCALGIV